MSIPKIYVLTTLFMTILIGKNIVIADNTLVIQFKHAPAEVRQEVEKLFEEKRDPAIFSANIAQKTPTEFSQKMVKETVRSLLKPKLSGFTCIYGGYTDISDADGLVSFPLRHAGDKVYVAITPAIDLVKLEGNTISHGVFKENTKRYLFTKKLSKAKRTASTPGTPGATTPANPSGEEKKTADDKASEEEIAYWEVIEQPVSAGEKIDPITVVILTNINNIAIIPNNYLATKNVQFVLPYAFYIIGNTNNDETVLKSLDQGTFFERIATEEKVTNNIKQRRIKNL